VKSNAGFQSSPVRQQGAALLLFTLVLLVAFSTFLVNKLNHRATRIADDSRQLTQAAEALRAYAAMQTIKGKLPCPDLNGDGLEESDCGTDDRSRQGWLPIKTLQLGLARDSSGSCLWYTVGGQFKRSSPTAVNAATVAPLHVFSRDGSLDHNDAVAVIISPGNVTGTQYRSSSEAHLCPDISSGSRITHARRYLEKHLDIDNAAATRDGAGAADAGYRALPTETPSAYIQSRGGDASVNDYIHSVRRTDLLPIYSLSGS
jgi:hypothetical protein